MPQQKTIEELIADSKAILAKEQYTDEARQRLIDNIHKAEKMTEAEVKGKYQLLANYVSAFDLAKEVAVGKAAASQLAKQP